MEALLSAFLAASLAEIGDKSQWLALALAVHFRRTGPVLAALALAATIHAAVAGVAGATIAPLLNREAATLMLALALGSAAVAMAFKPKPPAKISSGRAAFLSSLILLLAAELGDKTQFLTFAIATRTGMPVLSALGGAAGVFAIGTAAVLAGQAAMAAAPLAAIRRSVAALFAFLAFIAAINALRLI